VISTIATLINPYGIAVDDSGTLFVADPMAGSVYTIASDGSNVRVIAGNGSSTSSGDGGPATAAGLSHPGLVALDGAGSLVIGEFGSNRLRKVALDSGVITTTANASVFSGGLTYDSSRNLYVAEAYDHRILRLDAKTGTASVVAGTGVEGSSGDGGPATQATLSYPSGITFDSSGIST